jgi:phosphoribosylformylglycinamidine synthase
MRVRALVLTGYGLNCDYETDYALKLAGAESYRIHINELIWNSGEIPHLRLDFYHILVFDGGFSWGDDHGAGVLLACKMKSNLGDQIHGFIEQGKLIIGICNGFQALVHMGLLPGFEYDYNNRMVALTYNDTGNFIDAWVKLKINEASPCIFTKGLNYIELPVRHGEGKFYAPDDVIKRLISEQQVVVQYADESGNLAQGKYPWNPNGSLMDIAGICDPSGRIFGLMPHPEAFNHFTNHPDWTRKKEELLRKGEILHAMEGDGIRIFRNAVQYIESAIKEGIME